MRFQGLKQRMLWIVGGRKSSSLSFFPHPSSLKQGFTLLEMLVASLLLGMLVMILTMLFNQSSISWRIGTHGVYELDAARRQLANNYTYAENILPYLAYWNSGATSVDGMYRTISPWGQVSGGGKASLNGRSVMKTSLYQYSQSQVRNLDRQNVTLAQGQRSNNGKMYVVGVTSAGPDRQFGTQDDITTWPKKGE